MKQKLRSIPTALAMIAALTTITPSVSYGGPFDFVEDVADAVGDVAETGWRATTAPTRTVINTGRRITGHGSTRDIYKPFQDLGRSAADSVDHGTRFATAPQTALIDEVTELAQDLGSDEVNFIVDIGTLQQRITNEFSRSSGFALANGLRGQNPLQVTAAPLAAAIRAAEKQHEGNARQLPDDVKDGLQEYFSPGLLSQARYAVGSVEITLPNFIGRGHKFFSRDKAVVVNKIIVFPEDPPSFDESPYWWAHEVMHILQYQQMGIERFAYNYLRDLGSSIEGEAHSFGEMVALKNNQDIDHNHQFRSGFAQLGVQTPYSTFGDSDMEVDGFSSGHQAPEFFVAQCVFFDDPPGIARMVTNTGKLIAVETFTGRYVQYGWAAPPLAPGVGWTYRTRDRQWAVMYDGNITMTQAEFYPNGMPTGRQVWVPIGYVIRM